MSYESLFRPKAILEGGETKRWRHRRGAFKKTAREFFTFREIFIHFYLFIEKLIKLPIDYRLNKCSYSMQIVSTPLK